jgi:hypothetical protein
MTHTRPILTSTASMTTWTAIMTTTDMAGGMVGTTMTPLKFPQ